MTYIEPIGIKKIEALHYYVRDLDRSVQFYTKNLDFAVIARSGEELEARGRQRSAVLRAGECTVICSEPIESDRPGRAARWLKKHPDGVGTIVFEVVDVERCLELVEARGGTPIDDVVWYEKDGGRLGTFAITTPFGSSTFRFVERHDYPVLVPGTEPVELPRESNRLGFSHIDHITSNFETMAPALLWLEHVLGFKEYWNIKFHTEDVAKGAQTGSGLKSRVFWDPHSAVKFANNEPMRPFFKASQINLFAEDMRGDGIQHAALAVDDIVSAVRVLRERGVRFMPTPGAYYDMLPQRLEELEIGTIDEDLDVLRELEILVDGKGDRSYLLQIFLQDSAGMHSEAEAGPFFFEIIQRKGDKGFGGGNFRALFESIERQQQAEGRV